MIACCNRGEKDEMSAVAQSRNVTRSYFGAAQPPPLVAARSSCRRSSSCPVVPPGLLVGDPLAFGLQPGWRAQILLALDEGENLAEPLVLDDRGMVTRWSLSKTW